MLYTYLNYLISGVSEPSLPPYFGRLENPIPTRGQIMPTTYYLPPPPPPGFFLTFLLPCKSSLVRSFGHLLNATTRWSKGIWVLAERMAEYAFSAVIRIWSPVYKRRCQLDDYISQSGLNFSNLILPSGRNVLIWGRYTYFYLLACHLWKIEVFLERLGYSILARHLWKLTPPCIYQLHWTTL